MRVKISFTVDIDPESWYLNYSISGARDIREDAKAKAEHDLLAHWGPDNLDLLTNP